MMAGGQSRPPLRRGARGAVAYGAMHPKGACSASLHCVGIAPYEGCKGCGRATALPPSTLRVATSLTEGGFGGSRLRRGGETDSHASDIGHWLGMTLLRGVWAG